MMDMVMVQASAFATPWLISFPVWAGGV